MVSLREDSTMKIRCSAAIVISLAVSLMSIVAPIAKADGVGGLTSSQLQRFSRDLVPSNSQDFFRQGREQLEREIQRLDRQTLNSNEQLLKIEPQIQSNDDRSQSGWQRRLNAPRVSRDHDS